MNDKEKKVLAILPHSIGGRLTLSSIIDGFNATSFKTDIYDLLKDTHEVNNPEKYDFLLGYDFSAYEFCEKHNIRRKKTINYFSDVLEDNHSGKDWQKYLPLLSKKESLSFYWDKHLTEQIKPKIKNIFYLPHFVNTEIYRKQNIEKIFDVIFTGRLDTDYRLNTFINLIKAMPKVKFGWFAIKRHYEDALNRCNICDKSLIEKTYQYFIDNEKDMSKVLNQSKIVINFNEQGISSINYRTIQSMACQTLIISDYREDGIDYFGKNFIYYKNFNDMVDKVSYFLQNNKQRNYIEEELRKIIEKDFSHIAGAKKIQEKVYSIFYA